MILASLAATLLVPTAQGWSAGPPTCSVGRYIVDSTRNGVLVNVSSRTIVLAGGEISIADMLCPPAPVQLARKGKRTKVTAVWGSCATVEGPVRLTGTIRTAGCRVFAGRLTYTTGRHAKVRQRFRAVLSGTSAETCPGTDTFAEIERRILGPRGCRVQTCHGAGTAGGLDLRYGVAHASLVGAAATNAAAAATGKRRVLPGDPDVSFLWQKLSGHLGAAEGARMPQVGRPLDDRELALVRAWIAGGAPATGAVPGAACLPQETFHPTAPPDPPAGGYQLVVEGPTLQPGEEIEGCMWVRVPNTSDFVVGAWEYALNPGTHHFAIWDHDHGPEPELNVFKRDLACIGGGARFDGVTVSGAPEAPYFVDAYPAGVGRMVKGGSLLGLNPHYANDFDVPVPVKVWVNLHPVTGELRHLTETLISTAASLDGKSSYSIFVPPSSTAMLRLRYTNTTGQPLSVFQLSSHQHKRGTRFTAWRSDGSRLFENLDWSHPAILNYNPPLVLAPGNYIEYECEHDNGVTRPVRRCGDSVRDAGCTPGQPVPLRFGVTSDDDMCFLTGLFYTD